jgi:hypothetical protein
LQQLFLFKLKIIVMRLVLVLSIIIPFLSDAQINRSATELACERIKEYIETKLFKDQPYKAISYGDLKPVSQHDSKVAWTIEHKFEIETPVFTDKKMAVRTPHHFSFYLDKKLKILLAESFTKQ